MGVITLRGHHIYALAFYQDLIAQERQGEYVKVKADGEQSSAKKERYGRDFYEHAQTILHRIMTGEDTIVLSTALDDICQSDGIRCRQLSEDCVGEERQRHDMDALTRLGLQPGHISLPDLLLAMDRIKIL